ncbi:helix-turn-helix transcriptional regulator [Actinomycetospora callitridis]|uniref:helix-turn-helix transcriptional regulator n=1 Tax=Actinomycetospora callitridis TaxID=913944 RepID=UPI0023662845|nr:LuxR family transcriptional regulator [Actinomycetospora callitridis]MDD7921113.1 LuxR C-terminal-related transcriptional regulator [Actinomycetospora callitridis]
MPESRPLVGRSEAIAAAVAATQDDRLAAVVIGGPRGVGRTRLARTALAGMTHGAGAGRWRPSSAMTGRATRDIPLGALGHLLPNLDPALTDTASLLREARRLLVGAGPKHLVVVDDAHLLDTTSAVLLAQLARAGEMFLLLTVPTGAVSPEPLHALYRDGLATRLEITELDRAQSDHLVSSTLGGHVDGVTLDRFWELSLGNPRFLCELVDGARDEGALRRAGSVWRWDPPRHPPRRLIELLTDRLGGLAPAEQDLMRTLAFGQPLGCEVVNQIFPDDTLARLEAEGLITSTRDGRRLDVALTHPLYTELLRSRATPLQEREAYRRLRTALEASGSRRAGDRYRMLAWRAAEGLSIDPAELLAAADGVSDHEPRTAERLLRAAADQGAGAEVLWRLGRLRVALGRFDEAETAFATAAKLAEAGPDTTGEPLPDPVLVATARARNLYWGLRDEPGARAAVTAALAAAEGTATDTGAGESPLAVALRGFLALLSHRPADALAEVTPVLDGPDGDPGTTAALAVAAIAQVQLGRTEDAVPPAVRGLAAGPDPTGGWLTVELRSAQWGALLATGRLDDAEELARACHAEAAPGGIGEHVALYVTWLGIVASRRGRLQTAVRLLHEAASGVSSRRFPYTVPLVGELAVALAGLGRTTEGQDVLAEAHGVPGGPLTGWLWAAQVWIAGVEGRVTRATELAGEERPAASPSDHLRALHTAVRLGVGRPVLEAIERVAATIQGPLAVACVAHARALAAGDGAGLDEAAGRFAELDHLLLSAEAYAQACAAHRAAGHTGAAGWSASRSRVAASSCEGAETPASGLLERSGELTPRESEIAALAAGGLTSKAIADQLVISVRTVNNVLHAVYAKLGIARRGDLPEALGLRPS